jgi:hypothetical protein
LSVAFGKGDSELARRPFSPGGVPSPENNEERALSIEIRLSKTCTSNPFPLSEEFTRREI